MIKIGSEGRKYSENLSPVHISRNIILEGSCHAHLTDKETKIHRGYNVSY
jgi:hypothetical protein